MSTRYESATSLIRQHLFNEELQFLNDLFLNSYKYVYSNPYKIEVSKKINVQEPSNLKVALISFEMPNPVPATIKGSHENHEKHLPSEGYHYVSYTEENKLLPMDAILENITKCFKDHNSKEDPIHFLLLNELALSYNNHDDLIKAIKNRFNDMKITTTIGILGSYHCLNCYMNMSPVISPFVQTSELNYDYETVGEVPKQTSARKQGELIRTPDSTFFTRFDTPYGMIMVWICLDMYNPNLVINLIRNNYRLSLNRRENHENEFYIDAIFIPSYNRDNKDHVIRMGKFISKFARTTVFICNDSINNPKGQGWTDNFCFYFGEEIKPTTTYLSSTPGKCKTSIFRIDQWNKRKEVVSMPFKEDFSSAFGYIIGVEDGYAFPI